MPITLPVPGGGGATAPSTYYNGTNLGEYQFISLQEIIENFTAAYVGEGKLLENVLNGDIAFHAHRALQELHYDTVKSCKSQEITVCSSLKMPLPHDYVNYVKLTWVDNAGIEHIIYPTRNTSNPFSISQADDCSYEFEDGDLKQNKSCVIQTLTCSASEIPDIRSDLFNRELRYRGDGRRKEKRKARELLAEERAARRDAENARRGFAEDDGVKPKNKESDGFWSLPKKGQYNYLENWKSKVDNYCNCTELVYENVNDRPCGDTTEYDWTAWDCLVGKTILYNQYEKRDITVSKCADVFEDIIRDYTATVGSLGEIDESYIRQEMLLKEMMEGIDALKEISTQPSNRRIDKRKKEIYLEITSDLMKIMLDDVETFFANYLPWTGIFNEIVEGWPEDVTKTSSECTTDSETWSRYKTSALGTGSIVVDSAATINASIDSDIYTDNYGKRYGINPEYAQGNGSFYIDCMRGNIHFSSNIAGKTLILKYISDGHGTKDEAIVHKFAEEAMYKWIAYGCLGARVDTPEYVLQRLKKERFAETRKAKIRLSNIKIEEISQVFRGKSKWIKH